MTRVSRTRVGLVDSDAAIRREFASVFGSQPDFELGGAAGSSAQGLDLLSTRAPDVLLVDPALGDADGIGFIRRFHTLARPTEIVVITVFDSEQLVRSALIPGQSDTS